MALPVFQRTITDEKGNAVSGASVRVRHEMAGARNAKLKSDRDGTTPLANPASTDSAGFIRFYVASGAYRIDVTFGTTTITWRHVAIGLAAEKAGIAPGVTWKFASETADADPGSGFFRLNNSAASSATELYVSSDDANDTDQTTFLDSLDDGGGTGDRGTLIVQGDNADERLVIQVTGTVSEGGGSPPTYRKLSIVVQSASLDDLTAGGVFGFLFSQDAAAGGATALDLGDDGANESSAIDEIATQNDTNSVASNPTGDKLLFDMGQNWPAADAADSLNASASVTDYLDFPEVADESPPDLPPADTMRLRARDDGAGNTEMVLIDSAGNEIRIGPPKIWQDTKTDTASTTSDTFVDTGLSVEVTLDRPTDAVKVEFHVSGSGSGNGNTAPFFRLVRNSTVLLEGDAASTRPQIHTQMPMFGASASNPVGSASGAVVDSPGSVGPHTYKVQWRRPSEGTSYLNRGDSDSDASPNPRAASTLMAQLVSLQS